jgi:hypothetical protein
MRGHGHTSYVVGGPLLGFEVTVVGEGLAHICVGLPVRSSVGGGWSSGVSVSTESAVLAAATAVST